MNLVTYKSFSDLRFPYTFLFEGVILHAIRLLTVLETIVRLPNHWTGPFILGSWAITEIFRYPMYMFPNNQLCRSIRMVVPIVTFPIGAVSL